MIVVLVRLFFMYNHKLKLPSYIKLNFKKVVTREITERKLWIETHALC